MSEQWTEETRKRLERLQHCDGIWPAGDMTAYGNVTADVYAALAELAAARAHHESSYRQAIEDIDRVLDRERVLREALHNVVVIQGDTVTGDLARAALRTSSGEPKLNKVDEDPDGRC